MNVICNAHYSTLQIRPEKAHFGGRSSNGRFANLHNSPVKHNITVQIESGFFRLNSIICTALPSPLPAFPSAQVRG
jgi:hypothetical protein